MNKDKYSSQPMQVPAAAPSAYTAVPQQQQVYIQQQQQPTAVYLGGFPEHSIQASCPYCRNTAATVTQKKNGAMTWVSCFVIGLIFWPLCCVPFCVEGCKDTVHNCSACGAEVGLSKKL